MSPTKHNLNLKQQFIKLYVNRNIVFNCNIFNYNIVFDHCGNVWITSCEYTRIINHKYIFAISIMRNINFINDKKSIGILLRRRNDCLCSNLLPSQYPYLLDFTRCTLERIKQPNVRWGNVFHLLFFSFPARKRPLLAVLQSTVTAPDKLSRDGSCDSQSLARGCGKSEKTSYCLEIHNDQRRKRRTQNF